MCEDSTATNWDIYLDASSAEHVSGTQCRCSLLLHGDDRVVFSPVTVPGYTGCGTSIDVTMTGHTGRFGCERRYFDIKLNSGSTINITLNKPATLSQSKAVDFCYNIHTRYTGCGTSIEVMSTGSTTRVSSGHSFYFSLTTFRNYHQDTRTTTNMTVRCWSPGQDDNVGEMTVSTTTTRKLTIAIPNLTTESTAVTPKDKSATTTGIPDKTSTPTLGYTSSGQDCKQTTSDEKFPVEIVVPVVVVAVVFCVATIVGSVIYVRRHTDSIRNPTYDRHANTAAHDMHVYQDIH
ncbi:hypothetical protein ScPMuIL_011604 [Solemya velum]